MKILTAEFVKSAPSLKEAPDFNGLPEIAMVGRSNVGKSSCINALLNRKQLAKTSNTPGKTRLINFYNINEAWVFVDLPGYGYAKVSQKEQVRWQKHLEAYLTERPTLKKVLQLVDIRHGPQPSDCQMMEWLQYQEIPFWVVLTKADKLSKNEVKQQVEKSLSLLQVEREDVFVVSATSKAGCGELLGRLSQVISGNQ